eukprot:6175472-Pleurochrysis_carterae.AAC.4
MPAHAGCVCSRLKSPGTSEECKLKLFRRDVRFDTEKLIGTTRSAVVASPHHAEWLAADHAALGIAVGHPVGRRDKKELGARLTAATPRFVEARRGLRARGREWTSAAGTTRGCKKKIITVSAVVSMADTPPAIEEEPVVTEQPSVESNADDVPTEASAADGKSGEPNGTEDWLTEGHEWLGKRVARTFGEGIAVGTIVGWLPENEAEGDPALFHVLHDDLDEEDLEGYEVEAAFEMYRTDPRTAKQAAKDAAREAAEKEKAAKLAAKEKEKKEKAEKKAAEAAEKQRIKEKEREEKMQLKAEQEVARQQAKAEQEKAKQAREVRCRPNYSPIKSIRIDERTGTEDRDSVKRSSLLSRESCAHSEIVPTR